MDQIMEEARLCQEKLEELKIAAVQVSTTTITITTTNITTTVIFVVFIVFVFVFVFVAQAQRVGDIPRLQGLSQQVELCHAKQQDLLRERDDHQRLLR